MTGTFRWSDPAMTTTTPAPDDPSKQFSMDAAGNKPPKDGLGAMKRSTVREIAADPEIALYGDKPGDE
jgi:hypothetical protein